MESCLNCPVTLPNFGRNSQEAAKELPPCTVSMLLVLTLAVRLQRLDHAPTGQGDPWHRWGGEGLVELLCQLL